MALLSFAFVMLAVHLVCHHCYHC